MQKLLNGRGLDGRTIARRARQAQAKRRAAARAAAGAWLTKRAGTSKAGQTGKPTAQIEPRIMYYAIK